MMNRRSSLMVSVATIVVLGWAGGARAERIWVEAEAADQFFDGGFITSPMNIEDSAQASGDRYLQVANGNNSIASVPTLGRACKTFSVQTAGSYRVWARVIAPNDGDDSFWFNMNDGAWVRWNQIALGGTWHWDHVHDNATPTTPSLFTLAEGENKLCVAYREDGTKLDVFIITDEAGFSPVAALTGPPEAPRTSSWSRVTAATC